MSEHQEYELADEEMQQAQGGLFSAFRTEEDPLAGWNLPYRSVISGAEDAQQPQNQRQSK